MKKLTLLVLSTLLTTSCNLFTSPYPIYDPNAEIVDVYPAVYNLKDLNTQYDEYNSAPPPAYNFPRKLVTDTMFVYSTNSGTEGKNFDIWKGKVTFEQKSRLRGQKNPDPTVESKRIAPFLKDEINTNSNEFGPYFFYNPKPEKVVVSPPTDENKFSINSLRNASDSRPLYSSILEQKADKEILGDNIFFFASDKGGDLDIYFYSPKFGIREFFGNKKGSNERYFTYDYKRNVAYFASDRDGKYDIYKFENKTGNFNFQDVFNNKDLEKYIVKADEFNSPENDTCPVVVGDHLVFASDRVGTRGGYDIYLSWYTHDNRGENLKWQKPKNMQDIVDDYYKYKTYDESSGFQKYASKDSYIPKEEVKNLNTKVNTQYDEFRPFIIENLYNNQYSEIHQAESSDYSTEQNPSRLYEKPSSMIFSSNRPEGKGGFDLYLGILPSLYRF
ncbi:MAG: hypothetical protein U0354_02965 [Candidatus Sericytochromatia bacterium]